MEKSLKLLYINEDGVVAPFPTQDAQIEIFSFNYDAKRMGGAPTITASIMYPTCLDDVWSDEVFAEFNGERYYLKQTPTSSKSNTDVRYKHDVELVSERIILDNVFFYDVVVGSATDDKPVSNSSTFTFSGNIKQFAARLNASLQYAGLDDYTVATPQIDSEDKMLSFDNVVISEALQESYNQFEIPYYFVGKTIHFDFFENNIDEDFRYGADKELLSVVKTNANAKIITRCTGYGSTENIPYYYPNQHPQGDLSGLYHELGREEGLENIITVIDDSLFAKNVLLTDKIERVHVKVSTVDGVSTSYYQQLDYKKWRKEYGRKAKWAYDDYWFVAPKCPVPESIQNTYHTEAIGSYLNYDDSTEHFTVSDDNNIAIRISFDWQKYAQDSRNIHLECDYPWTEVYINTTTRDFSQNRAYYGAKKIGESKGVSTDENGIYVSWGLDFAANELANCPEDDRAIYLIVRHFLNEPYTTHVNVTLTLEEPIEYDVWEKNGRHVELSELGLSTKLTPRLTDYISFKQDRYVQPMPNLMPPIYWESNGAERFYNAKNYPFTPKAGYILDVIAGEYLASDGLVYNDSFLNADTGKHYTFPNPYKDNRRREHIVDFPDIKPTIENVLNSEQLSINVFTEFAYDDDDNDAIDTEGNYLHPYFYGKLRKFDGANGFNLFTHASEQGEMTISMISGSCAACNFVIGVNEAGKNPVRLDNSGKLIRDDNGNVVHGVPQDKQNDTVNNEVWIALKKDTSTFGYIMPSAQHNYKPSAGDEFVITNIKFPIQYVHSAEEKLRAEIIKYMHVNNVSKFTFSIKFSRIYFEENPDVLALLNENSLITVVYDNNAYTLYTNSFSYKMSENEPLPEITVELTDTLSASQNALQAAISEVKTDVLDRVQKMDIAALVAAKFLSKENEDSARAKLTFNRGLAVGDQDNVVAEIDERGHFDAESVALKSYLSSPVFRDGFAGEGFKLWLDKNGLSYLTVDVLTARQKMVIYELLISKLRAVNGEIWVSAANGKIASVEEVGDNYEIYFEDENMFVAGDYMRCQVWSGAGLKFYWVKVDRISGNVAITSKSYFTNSIPQAGDDVVLCGSEKVHRQNAIHISAAEDGQPRIAIYNNINSPSLVGCLRTQLGNLDGIEDEHFGKGVVKGDGLYSDNAFLKGDFVLKSTGKSVDTMFSITEAGVKSVVSTLQNDAERGKTILYNSTFAWGKRGWITSNIVTYYLSNDNPVYNDGKLVYNSVRNDVRDEYDNYRFILNIANGYIKQLNGYFINKPDINIDNLVPVSLGLQARVEEKGYLLAYLDGCTDMPSSKVNAYKGRVKASYAEGSDITVNIGEKLYTFASISNCAIGYTEEVDADNNTTTTYDEIAFVKNSDKTIRLINISQRKEIQYYAVEEVTDVMGEDISTPFVFIACEELAESSEYLPLEYSSRWNGTGNFNLAFSGGVSIYSLQLYTSATEARYATLFEQTEKIINIAAQHFNDNGSIAAQSGIMVKPEGTDMYAYNGTTGKYAAIGVAGDDGEGNTVVKLTGDKIKLVGDLTVDGKFKVRDDGSIEARNALFSGFVQQGTMYINDDNYTSFYKDANGGEITDTTTAWKALITNASPILILEHRELPSTSVYIELPSTDLITAATEGYTRPELDYARGFIGSTVILYNYTEKDILITYTDPDGTLTTKTDKLPSGNFIKMTCGLAYKSRNDKTGEYTYWDIDMEGKAINLPTK